MPRPAALQKAYTLIEVMMAAAVLVVSFVAVMQAVITGADLLDTARKQQIAQQIIDNEIGALRLGAWSNIATLANGTAYSITVNTDGVTYIYSENASLLPPTYSRFALGNNSDLLLQAKGFTCQAGPVPPAPAPATPSYLRPSGATPTTVTFLSITYTVTWYSTWTGPVLTSTAGRMHTRTGIAYFGQNGLNLSYQK